MLMNYRKIPFWKRWFEKPHVCMICGKSPADHWSYMVDNKGKIVNNTPPKFFHFQRVTDQYDKEIAELDKEIASLVKEVDDEREAKRAARIAKEDQENSVT